MKHALYSATIVAATIALFIIDISEPRGVVDGVGYAAVVALAGLMGKRAVVGSAAVTTILTLVAAAFVADAGISMAGMWANRFFALASIWIVALVMQRRLDLEDRLRQRTDTQRRHEAALATMVRECLFADITFDERLQRVCQTSAAALGFELALIGLRNDDNKTTTVMHVWRSPPPKAVRVSRDDH